MKRRGAEIAEIAEKRVEEPSDEINQLTGSIIGAAIEVHRELGPGFLELIYEEAMAVELTQRRVAFERQLRIPTFYKETLIGESRLDLLVEGLVVVELKAVVELGALHSQQVHSYLRAGGYEVGLLINFNVTRLLAGVRRIVSTY